MKVPTDYGFPAVGGGYKGVTKSCAFILSGLTKAHGHLIPPKPTDLITYYMFHGSYQTPAWDPTNTTTVVASIASDGKYEGYLELPAGAGFKFCPQPSGTIAGEEQTEYWDPNGGNITVADPGPGWLTKIQCRYCCTDLHPRKYHMRQSLAFCFLGVRTGYLLF